MKKFFRLFCVFNIVLSTPLICQAFQWPDTGQTTSYTETFGEDSDYDIHPQSYTKLGSGGMELSDDATFEDGWVMTRDNVTGMIWEVKTDDGSIHDKWNNLNELKSLVDHSKYDPAIDTSFFPDTVSYPYYWSSTTYADGGSQAWQMQFKRGSITTNGKERRLYSVRAVRTESW